MWITLYLYWRAPVSIRPCSWTTDERWVKTLPSFRKHFHPINTRPEMKRSWLAINEVWACASVLAPRGRAQGSGCGSSRLLRPHPELPTLRCFCLKLHYHFFLEQSASSFLSGRQVGDETMTQKNDLISPRSFWKATAKPSGACCLPQSWPPRAAWKCFSSGWS